MHSTLHVARSLYVRFKQQRSNFKIMEYWPLARGVSGKDTLISIFSVYNAMG